jgi:outer membrane biosynthesis protein TonB
MSPDGEVASPPIDCLMPASETPTNPPIPTPESEQPESASAALQEIDPESAGSEEQGPVSSGRGRRSDRDGSNSGGSLGLGYSTSRYVDYETHELLEKISQYEDERRWQRIREGIWISILAHILFFAALYFVPRYVFHQTQLIDPIQAIKDRKDLTYLDELPDALKQVQKAKPKLKPNEAHVDKKTLDNLKALEKAQPKPAPPPPEQAKSTPPPPVEQPQPQAVAPPSTAPPAPAPQIPLDTPRPSPVPARPNFSMNQQSPEDQLRQAVRDSAHGPTGAGMSGPPLQQHPGASGGAEILSDQMGVDFGPYLQKLIRETHRTWDPLIPEEVNPPILKRGECEIVFTILPNGRLQPHAMILTGRSGDVALDRAAWGAIESADYPPLPREFHGPYLQLRFRFMYNIH